MTEAGEVECPHCGARGQPAGALFSNRLFCSSCGRSLAIRRVAAVEQASRPPTDAEAFAKGCGFLLGLVFLFFLIVGGGLLGFLLFFVALILLDLYVLLALAYRISAVALSYLLGGGTRRPLPLRYIMASFPLPWYMLLPALLITGYVLLEVVRR